MALTPGDPLPAGLLLAETMRRYQRRLAAARDELNRINVFPIADLDTGSNLLRTVDGVIELLDDGHEPLSAIVDGSLESARGSSGVIVSQILRGWVSVLRDGTEPNDWASALAAGRDAGYQAVVEPREGTILTVARAAADGAAGEPEGGTAAVEAALDAARVALEGTTNQIDALRSAGVVDAGGWGYVILLEALAEAMRFDEGRPPETEETGTRPDTRPTGDFEVVCGFAADDEGAARLREAWANLGSDVVVSGGDGRWKAHVHTLDVSGALAAAQRLVDVQTIEVIDLTEAG